MARISDAVRAAVLADLRRTQGTVEGSHRKVAERHGISAGSVRNIANSNGLTSEAVRAQSKSAAQSQAATNAQRREALSARLLDLVEETIDDLAAGSVVHSFGIDGDLRQARLKATTAKDRKDLMTALGILIDKHKVLEQFDSAAAAGQQADLLLKLLTGQQS